MRRWRILSLLLLVGILVMSGPVRARENLAIEEDDEADFEEIPRRGGGHIAHEKFNRLVFPDDRILDGVGGKTQTRLMELAKKKIELADRCCKLNPEQKRKLELAARADTNRLFDRVDAARLKFHQDALKGVDFRTLTQETQKLRSEIQNQHFGAGSFFRKTLRATLTPEQFATFRAQERKELLVKHRANIMVVVSYLERDAPLAADSKSKLIDLLEKEIPIPAVQTSYSVSVVLYRIARLPDKKLKMVLTAQQLEQWSSKLDRYRRLGPQWEKQILVAQEDYDDEATEPAPAATGQPLAGGK